jgi:zinc protease
LAAGCGGAQSTSQSTLAWDSSSVDWARPPALGPEPDFQVPSYESFALKNGVQVVLVTRSRLPLVSLTIVNRGGGGANDTADRAGLAGLTADLLDEGAGDLDALGLANELQRLGASLDTGAGADSMTLTLDTLATTLEPSLGLVAQLLSRPRLLAPDFDRDFERVRADRLAEVKRRRDLPTAVAGELLDRLLFAGHPYALPLLGNERTLAAITLDDVREFYRRRYAPGDMVVVVCGDVTQERLETMLQATVGAWQPEKPAAAASTLQPPPAPPATVKKLAVVDRPGAPQSVIYMGRVSMTRTDPRYFVATVLNMAFGGSFASRLNNRLREQLGYTYGARSSFWMAQDSGAWVLRTQVVTEHTGASLREIHALLQTIRNTELPADELEKAKSLMTRSLPQSFESNTAVTRAFAGLAEYGIALDWFAKYAAETRAITAGAAHALAREHWDPEQLTVVVVGDLAKIHPDLLQLFGTSVEYTAAGAQVRTHGSTN